MFYIFNIFILFFLNFHIGANIFCREERKKNDFIYRCLKIGYIAIFVNLASGILRHPVEKWWTVSIDSRTVREIDRIAGALGKDNITILPWYRPPCTAIKSLPFYS